MQSWDNLYYFLHVAREGSFYKAAKILAVDSSTVSRRIARLEENLKCSLFDRHRYGLNLTQEGHQLYQFVTEMNQSAQKLEYNLKDKKESLAGPVCISATDGIAAYWIAPNLVAFHQDYPDIFIEITSDFSVTDLSIGDADIALRLTAPEGPDLRQQKLGTIQFRLFAAPQYLIKNGYPKNSDDLLNHDFIDYDGYRKNKSLTQWNDIMARCDHVALRTNSVQSYIMAIQSGLGIGMLPQFYFNHLSNLQALDIDLSNMTIPVYLVTHEQTRETARVRAVKSFIISLFEKHKQLWSS